MVKLRYIKEGQLNGTSNYRVYLDDNGCLNNDYEFSIEGE